MPIYKNLNEDSTHPRPWRPPTDFDVLKRTYDPYQIYTRPGKQYFERKHNWIEDDPALTNMYYAARKGLGFGKQLQFTISSSVCQPGRPGPGHSPTTRRRQSLEESRNKCFSKVTKPPLLYISRSLNRPLTFSGLLASVFDHVSFSRQQGWKSQALRAAYVTVPVQCMFVSYVAMRELSANVMERYGKSRSSNWTYVAAGMGPGTILMAWHSKLSSSSLYLRRSRQV